MFWLHSKTVTQFCMQLNPPFLQIQTCCNLAFRRPSVKHGGSISSSKSIFWNSSIVNSLDGVASNSANLHDYKNQTYFDFYLWWKLMVWGNCNYSPKYPNCWKANRTIKYSDSNILFSCSVGSSSIKSIFKPTKDQVSHQEVSPWHTM